MSNRYILDASVTLCWCFRDEASDFTRSVLRALDDGAALVPAVWRLDVINVLLVSERRGRLTRAEGEQFLALLSILPITIDNTTSAMTMERILDLGRSYHLTSYDAAYLELAMREGLALATTDAALRKAMQLTGVPLFAATSITTGTS